MTERDRPCKTCKQPTRYPGCHDRCSLLSDFDNAMETQRQRARESKARRDDYLNFKAEVVSKTVKRYGGKYVDML